MKRVYLDHNATSPLDPVVRDRWLEVSDTLRGNASSLHAGGRTARDLVDRAREQVAAALKVHEEEVIFTSGGTESNNTCLRGVMAAAKGASTLMVSATEHSSVLETAERLEREGHRLVRLGVDAQGRLLFDALEHQLRASDVALVSVHAANNETGTCHDLQHVAEVCRTTTKPGTRTIVHTDAVQALGRLDVDLDAWGVDLASFSAHKVGGPVGTGLLVRRRGTSVEPLVHGGGHEYGMRAGTEDVAGIVATALAVERAVEARAAFATRVVSLRNQLWHDVCTSLSDAHLVGPSLDSTERLPNTLTFLVPGKDGKVLITRLDLEGLAVGAGSACASGSLEPSHVLRAQGYDDDDARAALRVSLGATTTHDDCRFAADVFRNVFATRTT